MSEYAMIIDNIGIINTTFSGMFSITALLPAAYALIVNTINNQFCGMPITKIRRFNFVWFVLPLIYLCIIYLALIYSSKLYIFTVFFFIFMIYISSYLYMLLLPLFKKEKFINIAIRTLSRELSRTKKDEQQYLSYLNETIKQFIQEKSIPHNTFCTIHEKFITNIPQSNDYIISHQIIELTRLLYLRNNSQYMYSSFFIKLESIKLPLNHKFEYLISMLIDANCKSVECCESIAAFFSHSLKIYLNKNNSTNIYTSANRLALAIVRNGGFRFLLNNVYGAEYFDAEYIQFLYTVIIQLKSANYALKEELSSPRDVVFINELYDIIDGKTVVFKETLKYCDNLKTIDLIIKKNMQR